MLFFCLFVCFISFAAFMHILYSHVVQACLFRIKYWTRQHYVSWIPNEQKCDKSALCVQQIDVAKEIKFRSGYMIFVYHCNINNPEYHVRRRFDSEPSRIPVKKN